MNRNELRYSTLPDLADMIDNGNLSSLDLVRPIFLNLIDKIEQLERQVHQLRSQAGLI